MATVSKWTPYGVALNITATAGTVTRKSATQYTVVLNVSWKCYWSGNSTNYGMSATSGGVTKTISSFGSYRSSGSASFTGTYSISGTGKQTKSITVTFKNYNSDTGASSSKNVTLSVSVPAWPTYTVSYNANGGSGVPSSQTKVKDATLKLSTTKPTRTGYSFKNWNTASGGTGTSYSSGGSYTANAAATLYAQWTANTYTVKYNANGGEGAPANQTKTYGVALTLHTTVPTRTNYNFLGWAVTANAVEAEYAAGGSYTANSAATLYAVWELAYWPPKVTDVSATRCDADGNDDDFGTYFKIGFSWECCQLLGENNVSSIGIAYKPNTDAEYTTATTVTANGTTSGTQSNVLGGDLSIDETYDVLVTVTDSSANTPNHTNVSTTIGSYAFAIDFLKGGKGVAIGKPADKEGLDVAADIYMGWSGNDKGVIRGITPDGDSYLAAVQPCNENGNLVLGFGSYDAVNNGTLPESVAGNTNLYAGNSINMFAGGNSSGATTPGEIFVGRNSYGNMVINNAGYSNGDSKTYVRGSELYFESKNGAYINHQVTNNWQPNEGSTYHYNIENAVESTDTFYSAKRTDTGVEVRIGVGSGGTNHGVYSGTLNKWLVHGTASDVYVGGFRQNVNKVLWSGGLYMTADHTANLSEAVSKQPHGIIIALSAYVDGAVGDHDWFYYFVPKYHTANHNGKGICVSVMANAPFGHVGSKYLYVSDTTIKGHASNKTDSTGSGVDYDNNYWVLRYVIGV